MYQPFKNLKDQIAVGIFLKEVSIFIKLWQDKIKEEKSIKIMKKKSIFIRLQLFVLFL